MFVFVGCATSPAVGSPTTGAEQSLGAEAEQSAPALNRYLSAEQINSVVRNNQAAIRQCYQEGVLRQANLQGRVELAWRISVEGAVSECRVTGSTLNEPRVEECIVREVRSWRFPRPDGGEVSVDYPFIFGQRR